MGNCTVTLKHRHIGVGASVEVVADVALSTSYATGGDTLTLKSLGLDTVHALLTGGGALTATGHAVEVVNATTDSGDIKLRIRDVAAGTEIGAATNLSASTIRVVAKGNYPGV